MNDLDRKVDLSVLLGSVHSGPGVEPEAGSEGRGPGTLLSFEESGTIRLKPGGDDLQGLARPSIRWGVKLVWACCL